MPRNSRARRITIWFLSVFAALFPFTWFVQGQHARRIDDAALKNAVRPERNG